MSNETNEPKSVIPMRPSQEQCDEAVRDLVRAMNILNLWDGTEYTHVFLKPFQWQGDTFEKLTFNFASLTGADAAAAEADARRLGATLHLESRTYPQEYLAAIAVRCCTAKTSLDGKLGLDAFRAMPIQDFQRIVFQVRNFFLHGGL